MTERPAHYKSGNVVYVRVEGNPLSTFSPPPPYNMETVDMPNSKDLAPPESTPVPEQKSQDVPVASDKKGNTERERYLDAVLGLGIAKANRLEVDEPKLVKPRTPKS